VSDSRYRPDLPINMTDAMIRAGSGPEPHFDTVMQTFLFECLVALRNACQRGGLLRYASLGVRNPWLYRLEFRTRGLARDEEGEIATVERHVLALRFLPDYLRVADRFAMLRLIEPSGRAFHPNISSAGAICVEIYPGESVIEICQSLHDLFRWRLRQYDERDALNPAACAWGRQNIDQPIDDRPLFGQRTSFQWRPTDNLHGEQA
jgi:hypothetical protein